MEPLTDERFIAQVRRHLGENSAAVGDQDILDAESLMGPNRHLALHVQHTADYVHLRLLNYDPART